MTRLLRKKMDEEKETLTIKEMEESNLFDSETCEVFERFYANVTFEKGDRKFSFFTTINDLYKGDKVIVQTQRGLGIATFVSYIDPNTRANNWIVQKIDMKEYRRNTEIWRSK